MLGMNTRLATRRMWRSTKLGWRRWRPVVIIGGTLALATAVWYMTLDRAKGETFNRSGFSHHQLTLTAQRPTAYMLGGVVVPKRSTANDLK